MCAGDLEYEKVGKALIRMFGGDHQPNAKDLAIRSSPTSKEETFLEEDDEEWYEEDEEAFYEEWYDDEIYDEEVPRRGSLHICIA